MSWREWKSKNVRERLKPYIGSGLRQAEVARRLGVSRVAVHRALKRMGASLKPDEQKAA